VAAAGQQWLHEMGLDNTLEQGTPMSVQVSIASHHWPFNVPFYWQVVCKVFFGFIACFKLMWLVSRQS
jgi:hypothetical protein